MYQEVAGSLPFVPLSHLLVLLDPDEKSIRASDLSPKPAVLVGASGEIRVSIPSSWYLGVACKRTRRFHSSNLAIDRLMLILLFLKLILFLKAMKFSPGCDSGEP